MAGKIKNIITYAILIAIPLGIVIIVAKWYFSKKTGNEQKAQEAVDDGIKFIGTIFKIFR